MANQGVSVCWCVQIYKGRPFRKVEKTKSSKKAARASIFSCALASPSLSIFRGGVGGVVLAFKGQGEWYGWRAVTYLRARPASAERKRWLPRRRARHLLQAERPTKKKKRKTEQQQQIDPILNIFPLLHTDTNDGIQTNPNMRPEVIKKYVHREK